MWNEKDLVLGSPDADHLHEVWGVVAHYIEDAIPDSSTTSIQQLFGEVLAGMYQLWVITHHEQAVGALLLEVQGTTTDIVYLGGVQFDQWGPLLMLQLEQHARDAGMTQMRICGRAGWSKLFRDYKEQTRIIAKQL